MGAGRGMRCHGLKGGIGSASRVVELDGKQYTIGALVLSNHAVFDDLVVAGTPIQSLLDAHIPPHEDKGSIITVLATDIPLSERQLRRLCHRALVGLSRTGSFCGNGSGEIVIAFTTANRVPHYSEKAAVSYTHLDVYKRQMDENYKGAVVSVVETPTDGYDASKIGRAHV